MRAKSSRPHTVGGLTGQGQHLVADINGCVMLASIQRILAPGAQEFFHERYEHVESETGVVRGRFADDGAVTTVASIDREA